MQIMACHLIGTKPLPEPIMSYFSLDLLSNTYYVAFKQTSKLFITCIWYYRVSPCSKFGTGNVFPPGLCQAITWTKLIVCGPFVNELKLYWNQWDSRLLWQVKACHLINAKPLSELMKIYCSFDLLVKPIPYFNQTKNRLFITSMWDCQGLHQGLVLT